MTSPLPTRWLLINFPFQRCTLPGTACHLWLDLSPRTLFVALVVWQSNIFSINYLLIGNSQGAVPSNKRCVGYCPDHPLFTGEAGDNATHTGPTEAEHLFTSRGNYHVKKN